MSATAPEAALPPAIANAMARAYATHAWWQAQVPEPPTLDAPLPACGEIRRHAGVGRLVVCVSDPITFACGRPGMQIALMDSVAELADRGDLVIHAPEVAPYPIVLRLLTTVLVTELEPTIYGILPAAVIAAYHRRRQDPPAPHVWGTPLTGPDDPRWGYHVAEAEVAQAAGSLACAFEWCDH